MRKLGPKVTRMSGAGNSFFFVDGFTKPFEISDRREFARLLCQSTTGLHADGVVIVEKTQKADFRWDFYNEDGSSAEMCGNAARCAGFYFFTQIQEQPKLSFETIAGTVHAEILSPGWVRVDLPKLRAKGEFKMIRVGKKSEDYFCINTGVPHVIVEGEPNAELAEILRRAEEFGPAGSNVTFVQEDAPGEMKAVTFERGVEDFTLACGTGAVAAAAFGREANPFLKSFLIEMPGGELSVEWTDEVSVALTGPARFDFELQLDERT